MRGLQASEHGIIASGTSSRALESRRRSDRRSSTASFAVIAVGVLDLIRISLTSGEGRFGQEAQGLVEQTVLLRAEQKACPALDEDNVIHVSHTTVEAGARMFTHGSSAQAGHVRGSPEQGSLEPTLMSLRRNATPAAAAGLRGIGAGSGDVVGIGLEGVELSSRQT